MLTYVSYHIFSWKICSSLVRSESNRLKMESYKKTITVSATQQHCISSISYLRRYTTDIVFIYSVVQKEEYDARKAEEPKGADDDIMEVSNL